MALAGRTSCWLCGGAQGVTAQDRLFQPLHSTDHPSLLARPRTSAALVVLARIHTSWMADTSYSELRTAVSHSLIPPSVVGRASPQAPKMALFEAFSRAQIDVHAHVCGR